MATQKHMRLLTKTDVSRRLQISERSLRRLVAAGKFPRPLDLGIKGLRWREADLLAFFDDLNTSERSASNGEGH